jgi:phosphoserine phosphatase
VTHILSLIAPPRTRLDPSIVETATRVLAGARCAVGGRTTLGPDAVEIAVSGDVESALATARAAIDGVDVNVVAAAPRRKRLLVADMESTLMENEMLDDLAAMVGLGEAIAAITRRAMNGEVEFRAALRERVALLKGLPEARLREAAAGIRIVPGAGTLVRTMRAHGAFTAIVSGGFRFFTGMMRERLGCDHDEGNELELADGRLTGRVREPVLDRDAKRAALRRLTRERAIDAGDTLAVGDGANDVPMLREAALGVAFRAKPSVAAAVATRIDHGDLTALLYLQGYRREEFRRRRKEAT